MTKKLTPEQLEILHRTEKGELHFTIPETSATRRPSMAEREQITKVSHPNQPPRRNDV